MKKRSVVAAITGIAMFATAAFAAVTFDPATGLGFVGKGDVQTLLGLSNSQMQAVHTDVTFRYDATEAYTVTVEFDTGNPDQPRSLKHHVITKEKSSTVSASIAASSRKTGQWTGWNLTGFGVITETGDPLPSVGDECPNGNLGTCVVTAVELDPSSSTGGLYAVYKGNDYPLQ